MNTPDRHIPGLPPHQEAIRAKCFHPTGTFIEFKKEEIEQSIPERFEQQVRRYPDRLAVKTRSQALTYAQLNKAANRVAHTILESRGEGQEPVALLFDQGAQAVAAILGILKAGKFYIPLDPSFPRERTTQIMADSQTGIIVTNSQNVSTARELGHDEIQSLNIDNVESTNSRKLS